MVGDSKRAVAARAGASGRPGEVAQEMQGWPARLRGGAEGAAAAVESLKKMQPRWLLLLATRGGEDLPPYPTSQNCSALGSPRATCSCSCACNKFKWLGKFRRKGGFLSSGNLPLFCFSRECWSFGNPGQTSKLIIQ